MDRAAKNVTMSPAFAHAATARPLALARTLLECFGAWASAGYILDEVKPDQFTLDGYGRLRGTFMIRHASAHQPEHRPSFAEMVDHLDRFEKQKRGN